MGKTSKNKTVTKKSREELLRIKKMSDIQLAMIDDPTIISEHVTLYARLSLDYPTLDIKDPIYIKNNIERMTLWRECASKVLQATILMNEDSMTEIVTQKLENNEYIIYVQLVLDHYNKK